MPTKKLDELPLILEGSMLAKYIIKLRKTRKATKLKNKRGAALSNSQRLIILQKTDHKCHICGKPLIDGNFEADHVKAHIAGGAHSMDNYLPSCKTCNNYRWHYGWEEIQYILKIGVWAKTLIEKNNKLGKILADGFISHDIRREKRRRSPR